MLDASLHASCVDGMLMFWAEVQREVPHASSTTAPDAASSQHERRRRRMVDALIPTYRHVCAKSMPLQADSRRREQRMRQIADTGALNA